MNRLPRPGPPADDGPVHFTRSDPNAVLPANTTLTNGVGTFSATLNTASAYEYLYAQDTVNGGIQGTSNSIWVNP